MLTHAPRTFTADEIADAETLAQVAAAGLARLEAEHRRSARAAQDRALVRAARALNVSLELHEVLRTLAREAALALGADIAGVYLGNARRRRRRHRRPQRAGRLARARARARRGRRRPGAAHRPHVRHQRLPERHHGRRTPRCAASAPPSPSDGLERRAQGRAVGRLDVDAPRRGRGPPHAGGDRRPRDRRLPQRRDLRRRPAGRAHRRAHRPAQPRRHAGPRARGDRPRPPRRHAAQLRDHRPRRLQARQRRARPPGRRRAAAPGRRRCCRPSCARTTRSPATAATSSCCCCPAATRRPPARSPSASATRWRPRWWAPARSASPSGTSRSTPTRCSSTPTARCCWPSAPARAAWRSPTPTSSASSRCCRPQRGSPAAVQALAAAIEERDNYTHEHSEEVVHLARGVAMLLGLQPTRSSGSPTPRCCTTSASSRCPHEILHKPGPLTPEEWERHGRAPGRRRADPAADPRPGRDRADRAPRARALGRQRLPGRPARPADPDRLADHPRLRRLPRDDHRPARTARRCRPPRRPTSCAAAPARSSTPRWSTRCSTCSATTRRRCPTAPTACACPPPRRRAAPRRALIYSALVRLRRRDQRRAVGQPRLVQAAVLRALADPRLRRLACRCRRSAPSRGSRATSEPSSSSCVSAGRPGRDRQRHDVALLDGDRAVERELHLLAEVRCELHDRRLRHHAVVEALAAAQDRQARRGLAEVVLEELDLALVGAAERDRPRDDPAVGGDDVGVAAVDDLGLVAGRARDRQAGARRAGGRGFSGAGADLDDPRRGGRRAHERGEQRAGSRDESGAMGHPGIQHDRPAGVVVRRAPPPAVAQSFWTLMAFGPLSPCSSS